MGVLHFLASVDVEGIDALEEEASEEAVFTARCSVAGILQIRSSKRMRLRELP